MEKETTSTQELEAVKTTDLVESGGILLDVEGRQLSLKTANDGHVCHLIHIFLNSSANLLTFYTDNPGSTAI
jgi:hypothetical protein